MDDVEAAFAAAIMQTAELVIPLPERRRPGRGWTRDAQTEAELQTATDAMHAAWQRLKIDTRDAQLRKAARKTRNWLKRVRSAAAARFFERHVVELEKQLSMGDQHGFFQNIKSRRRRRSNHSASVTRKRYRCVTKGVSARVGCNSSVRC